MQHPTRFTRRNYWAFVFEGGFYGIGLAFVARDTLLPAIANDLGAPDAIIAFLPMAMMIGNHLPPLFTSHWIERHGKMLPILRVSGFLSRLPYGLAALILWFFGRHNPQVAIWAVALTPLIGGLIGGLTAGAWFRWSCSIVAGKKRASSSALRNLMGSCVGIGAGFIMQQVLIRYPGVEGYAVLHAIAWFWLLASYSSLCLSEEPDIPRPPKAHHKSLARQFKSLLPLLKSDKVFSCYALSLATTSLVYATIPFMVIHAMQVLGRGAEVAGIFTACMMGGRILANVIGGWLGDKRGGRLVLISAQLVGLCMLALFVLNGGLLSYSLCFALMGGLVALKLVGGDTFIAEHGHGPRMPTYTSLFALANLAGMLAAGATSALVRQHTEEILPLALISASGLAASVLLLAFGTVEPRNRGRIAD